MRQNHVKLQGEIAVSITIAENLNIPLSEMDRFSKQKIGGDLVKLNNIINPLDIKNI